jgi:hypothetical protein
VPSVGIKLSPQNCTISDLRAVWRIADEAGFDHLWAFDHFNPIFADVATAPAHLGWRRGREADVARRR